MKLKDVRDGFILANIFVALVALGAVTLILGFTKSGWFFLLVPSEWLLVIMFARVVANRKVYGNWRGEIR